MNDSLLEHVEHGKLDERPNRQKEHQNAGQDRADDRLGVAQMDLSQSYQRGHQERQVALLKVLDYSVEQKHLAERLIGVLYSTSEIIAKS